MEQHQIIAKWHRQLDLARAFVHSDMKAEALKLLDHTRFEMKLVQVLGLPSEE